MFIKELSIVVVQWSSKSLGAVRTGQFLLLIYNLLAIYHRKALIFYFDYKINITTKPARGTKLIYL